MKFEDFFGDDVRRPNFYFDENGSPLQEPLFIDLICKGYDFGNPSQIAISCIEVSPMEYSCKISLREIEELFWIAFLRRDPRESENLLNYHLSVYLEKGGKQNAFLEWAENGFTKVKADESFYKSYTNENLILIKEKYFKKWVANHEINPRIEAERERTKFSYPQAALICIYEKYNMIGFNQVKLINEKYFGFPLSPL